MINLRGVLAGSRGNDILRKAEQDRFALPISGFVFRVDHTVRDATRFGKPHSSGRHGPKPRIDTTVR